MPHPSILPLDIHIPPSYLTSTLPPILLIRNSLMPRSPPKSSHKMNHNTPIIRPMPIRSPRRSPDNIPSHQYLRHAASIADPATTSNDSDHLALFTGVPVSVHTRRKCDVSNG
jgi:hypothetical protein